MRWKSCAVLWMVTLLAGCAVPVARYYSLLAPTPGTPSPTAAHPLYGLHLQVSQVPAQVDRPQLVVQDPSAGPMVQVLNNSLWAAPLRDQVQGRLAADVANTLGVPDLTHLLGAGAIPLRTITVRVTRFDLVWGQAALLDANWTDQMPSTHAARVCQARLSVAAGPGIAALVEAQQRSLDRLSTLIAQTGPTPTLPQGSGVLSSGCTW